MYKAERKEICIGGWCGKTEGKRTLGKHRSRRKDNITVDVKGIGCVLELYSPVSREREILVCW